MEISVNKEEWIKALRSGEYKQCKGSLTNGNESYCCLGVWAKINGFEPYHKENIDEGEFDDYMIKEDIIYHYGLFDNLMTHYKWRNLSEKNDDGYTFQEIADIIEETIEEKTITIN